MTRAFGTRVYARRTLSARSRTVNTRVALLSTLALSLIIGPLAGDEHAYAQDQQPTPTPPAPPPGPEPEPTQPSPNARPARPGVRTRRANPNRPGRTTFIAPPANAQQQVPPAAATPGAPTANGVGDDFTVVPGSGPGAEAEGPATNIKPFETGISYN